MKLVIVLGKIITTSAFRVLKHLSVFKIAFRGVQFKVDFVKAVVVAQAVERWYSVRMSQFRILEPA